ncbi:MAG: efflux transporter outer membrane subunit [Steroidobacteraceae bacterium]
MRFRSPIAFVALACLAGCALRPPATEDVSLRATAPLAITSPSASDSAAGSWPTDHWWQRYRDPTLDALLERALAGAPSLNTAAARLASARQSVRVTGAGLGVQVAAQGSFTRQRLSDNGLLPPEFLGFNWYDQSDLGLTVNYTFDWWGRQRSLIEASLDDARAAQAERAAAQLGLAAAVAQTYFGWQADAARLQLARERLALLEKRAVIETRRTEAELDSGDAVQVAAHDVAASREGVALLEGSQRLRVVTLAALLGVAVEALPPLEARALPSSAGALPANLTIDLIARRPEVQASRWRVEAARQQLSAVGAEYYPDVSLRALVGLSSIDIGKLLQTNSAAPAFTAAVHLPLFDSGLRGARFGARQAQVVAAVADYDEAIVEAARDVGQAATRLTQASAQREQRLAQQSAAQTLVKSASARVRAGTTDLRPQLQAELSLLQERDAVAQLEFAMIDADISLQQALGGGYDASVTDQNSARVTGKLNP